MDNRKGLDVLQKQRVGNRHKQVTQGSFVNTTTDLPQRKVRFIDLFCGIGGFRLAAQNVAHLLGVESECVFSSDIDTSCQDVYETNFGDRPAGDITKVNAEEIPAYDLLLAGFPCQPFSIIGNRKGFEDTRGTLFSYVSLTVESI